MVSSRSGLPRRKFSQRAVSVNGNGKRARRLHRRGDALHGLRRSRTGAARRRRWQSSIEPPTRPAFAGQADGQRGIGRRIAEAVLQVGCHRQIGGLDDGAGMGQRLVARDLAIAPAEHAGRRTAGRGQRREAQASQRARAARVPGVGDDETRAAMQARKASALSCWVTAMVLLVQRAHLRAAWLRRVDGRGAAQATDARAAPLRGRVIALLHARAHDDQVLLQQRAQPDQGGAVPEETGLDYEPLPVDTRKGEQFAPAFMALNPNAKVPVIVDGDVTVFDSNAILLYLAEKPAASCGGDTPARAGPAVVADVRGQRRRAVFRAGGALQALRARAAALCRSTATASRRGATTASSTIGWRGTLHAGRRLQHRRHGGVGLGAAGALRAGRRGALPQLPHLKRLVDAVSAAPGGGALGRAARRLQVQDRDRRRGAALPVPAERLPARPDARADGRGHALPDAAARGRLAAGHRRGRRRRPVRAQVPRRRPGPEGADRRAGGRRAGARRSACRCRRSCSCSSTWSWRAPSPTRRSRT